MRPLVLASLLVLAALAHPVSGAEPVGSVTINEIQDGSVRVTAPGGLVLHHRIPAESPPNMVHRFQVNAPKKGMNRRDLKVSGEVYVGANGVPAFRGSCEESSLVFAGKMFIPNKKRKVFFGSLAHGRHTAIACEGVLVQVILPPSIP